MGSGWFFVNSSRAFCMFCLIHVGVVDITWFYRFPNRAISMIEMTVKEYAKKVGVHPSVIKTRCQKGEVRARKEKCGGRAGYRWLISEPIGDEKANEKAEDKSEVPKKVYPPLEAHGEPAAELLRLAKARQATEAQARRLLKIEQALKMNYENRLREKSYVLIDAILSEYAVINKILIDEINEGIDRVCIKLDLPGAALKALLKETRLAANRAVEKFKKMTNEKVERR